MEVDAAVVPAADVSCNIDDREFVLERLATPSAMNSNPVSVGSGGCSRHDEAPVRTLHEDVFDRSIDVQILRLRRKLEQDPSAPQMIQTERGVGYIFARPVERF
jgi:hypothetical protein